MKADEKKSLSREEALIKILERFAKQMDAVENRLTAIENYQKELFYTVESSQPRYKETNSKLGDLRGIMLKYHAEMGKIVSAQDNVDKSVKTLSGRQEAGAIRQADLLREQESLNKQFVSLSDRFEVQEKISNEHYGLAVKFEENITKVIDGFGNRVSNLHGETEKLLTNELRETNKNIDNTRLDIMSKMLSFDSIEESLATLLFRTEPPEPKPPMWPIRLFRKAKDSLNLQKARYRSKRNSSKLERKQRRMEGKRLREEQRAAELLSEEERARHPEDP